MDHDLGERLEAALGELLQRRTRLGLYADLVDGIGRGLDISSYPLLSGIARIGPSTAVRLGREIGLDRSGTSRYASRLETGGLLRRVPDPADVRGTLLCLTDDGEKIVALLRGRLADLLGLRLAGWPEDDARSFVAGLERFVTELR
ncbi:Transcriptional regulator, MarR family [Frankia sp. AiPs1]|uniref:MarR family winged helix-turn-helix transcriptional regulator n=1 Tax=Frankia sp. AiPa1 TaxID=573492 RepID=UPI00202AF45A|nr:MarR family winged helix-turn-helix transcriptional regulator [Frankia sp. AiPa1]MCL9760955.1 MarR family winged helix-turn-helix transcriptional regulator [Frankia sp. AiPa1]